jgi:hypothetical protein
MVAVPFSPVVITDSHVGEPLRSSTRQRERVKPPISRGLKVNGTPASISCVSISIARSAGVPKTSVWTGFPLADTPR